MASIATKEKLTIGKQIALAHEAHEKQEQDQEDVTKPNIVRIDNNEYYTATDVQKCDPVFFYGCVKTVRKIIDLKEIPNDQYVYATNSVKNGWTIVKDQNKPPHKATLLLTKDWVQNNVPAMKIKDADVEKKTSSKKVLKDNIAKAPDILVLNDCEKFRDDDGNIIEIETRGKRTYDGIYFLLSDVAVGFKMGSLVNVVTRENRGFERREHYEYFINSFSVPDGKASDKKFVVKKRLYLTYMGILKILFSGRSGNIKKIIKWCTEILFTVQMGTKVQKEALASDMLGISMENLSQILSCSALPISCIYRFALGKVRDLRGAMNISEDVSDDHIVVKYGFTDNLKRRAFEHKRTYGSISDQCQLRLLGFAYIDPGCLAKAESMIREYFRENAEQLRYNSQRELLTYDPSYEHDIKECFGEISHKYSGFQQNTTNERNAIELKMIGYEHEINRLKQEIALQKALHDSEMKGLKYEHDILILKTAVDAQKLNQEHKKKTIVEEPDCSNSLRIGNFRDLTKTK